MPDLSIKNVPESVVAELRSRAKMNHRSLQGELMSIVCQAAEVGFSGIKESAYEQVTSGWITAEQLLAEQKAQGIEVDYSSPQAVDIIRQERDARAR
ncbi:MAG: Arc family DNA-binding protein [Gammaproteobacteria bacterium]|nr:Arc family DNA-binding protein [Gammaproteobacteria bacterium]MCY4198460.1 Arc family DNA-binding protein [Gammaproteobacteria bacterium]MCY4277428.1 Arc family DNA-binding protein [Gammaproteobacteria bacterium]MCY4322830.1 Arc family DNA-binding protein [Gammaproteobacteria bacterium]